MRGPYFNGVGGVLSADIAVPEHQKVHQFYASVLTTGPTPLWQDDLTNSQGTPVIGLGPRTPEYDTLPVQWMPHIQVEDVDTGAVRATRLGGSELLQAKGDDGRRQWSVLTDPAGAPFGLIPAEPDDSNNTNHTDPTGTIAWLALAATDPQATADFYHQVVGWSPAPAQPDGRVEFRGPDGHPVADIAPITPDPDHIPQVWLLTLPVNDFDESLRRVREHGGRVLQQTDTGHAVIRDPVGAHIALQAHT